MMVDSWFDPVNEKLPDFVYRAVRGKAEIMEEEEEEEEEEEALLNSLDPQGLVWDYREVGGDFLQQQEEIFLAAYSGKADSSLHQLLPLPPTTSTSSSAIGGALRNLKAFNNSSCCETSSSGLSQAYPESFCSQRAETERHHCSIPKLAERKREKFRKARQASPGPASISFSREDGEEEVDFEAIAQVKEIIYIAAALRPVAFGAAEEAVQKPRRKNQKISNDPQTAAARRRRERISDRLRALQRLVPGGRKMDTASMLDEAANYLKFLKAQVTAFEKLGRGDGSFSPLKAAAAAALSFYSSPNQTCIFPLQNF